MKLNRYVLGVTVALIAALALVLPAAAQEVTPAPGTGTDNTMNRTITVQGSATTMGEPNNATVELGVEIVDPNLATAFSEASQIVNNVIDAIRGAGIPEENIQTSGVNVFPEERYDPQTGNTGERVYRVRYILTVTINDTSLIEPVINGAVEAGANTIYNLNFGIDDASALEADARTRAVQNAREKAQQIADALGVTLGAPVTVVELSGQNGGGPIPLARGAAMESAAMPISTGQLGVTVTVEIAFGIGG